MWNWLKKTFNNFLILLILLFGGTIISPVPVTGEEIMITFTAPGDDGSTGTATTYLVFYSTQEFDALNVDSLVAEGIVDTAQFCPVPSPAGSVEVCTLTNLLDDTDYWIAVKTADEESNWSGLSNVITAHTDDVTPPRDIDDLMQYLE